MFHEPERLLANAKCLPSGAHEGLMLSERGSVALLRIFPSGVAIQTPSVPAWFVTNAIGGSVMRTELRDASATTRAAVRAVAAATTRTSTCASDFDLPQLLREDTTVVAFFQASSPTAGARDSERHACSRSVSQRAFLRAKHPQSSNE